MTNPQDVAVPSLPEREIVLPELEQPLSLIHPTSLQRMILDYARAAVIADRAAGRASAEPEGRTLTDDELVDLGRCPTSNMPPWGIGSTRGHYLQAVRAALAASPTPTASVEVTPADADELVPTRGTTAIVNAWNDLPDELRLSPHLCKLFEAVKTCRDVSTPTASIGPKGEGEANPITLTKSKVDAFRAIAYEGGSADVLFRVGSNDIDADEIGKLCSKLHSDIRVCVVPPPPPADDTDEDNGAPLFEEPSDARLAAESAFSDPGAEGMDPSAGFDATDALLDDVQRNGVDATAKA
jgi:hypothetical protein